MFNKTTIDAQSTGLIKLQMLPKTKETINDTHTKGYIKPQMILNLKI